MFYLALIASASAVSLNSFIYPHPDYFADGYSDTWQYVNHNHLVNETSYVDDQPASFSEAVKDFPGDTANPPYEARWLPTTDKRY